MKRLDTHSDTCAFSVPRKYLVILVFSFRNGNVSQALVRSSSLEESTSVSLQKDPTEGASSHVVVTSEQNSEPPTSLLPHHPSEDQKLYQDLLVICVYLIFFNEHNSQSSTLMKLWCGIGMNESCMWFSSSHVVFYRKVPGLWFFIFFSRFKWLFYSSLFHAYMNYCLLSNK